MCCLLSCGVWVTYIIQKRIWKNKNKKTWTLRGSTPSNPKWDIVTIWPCYQSSTFLFFAARARRATQFTHMHSIARERGDNDWWRITPSDRATSHSSTPRICHTLVVWPAAAFTARRGCNVVGVLCMLSDFYISWVSFGEATHNIGNINTVGVLIFNPNDPYISVHSERGSVTHSSSRDTGIDGELRTADSDGHNYCATAVQSRWACHTRTVLLVGAYGRQRCKVVTCACSVVYLWYMSWAVCSWEGTKTDKILPVRTYKIGLIQRNPGNRLIHSRRKNICIWEHATRATVLGSSKNLDHRFRTAFLCRRI